LEVVQQRMSGLDGLGGEGGMNVWEKEEIWKRYLGEICGNEEMAPLAGGSAED
jgi:hypothetical protein